IGTGFTKQLNLIFKNEKKRMNTDCLIRQKLGTCSMTAIWSWLKFRLEETADFAKLQIEFLDYVIKNKLLPAMASDFKESSDNLSLLQIAMRQAFKMAEHFNACLFPKAEFGKN